MKKKSVLSSLALVLAIQFVFAQVPKVQKSPTSTISKMSNGVEPKIDNSGSANQLPDPNTTYVTILSPKDGSTFIGEFTVSGIINKSIGNSHLWLVVCPQESIGCWPQYREIKPNRNTGEWKGNVKIGGDDGKLIDIVVVEANLEAHNYFNTYILNQVKDGFPTQPMPEGAKVMAQITVKKAPQQSFENTEVNKNYGFSQSGTFYIHKSIIEESGGEIPCLVAGVTGWKNDTRMELDGEYYVYQAKIDKPITIKLEYCFYIGNGNYLPQLLIENSSSKIDDGDYKPNESLNGNNFYTSPQVYYPGEVEKY